MVGLASAPPFKPPSLHTTHTTRLSPTPALPPPPSLTSRPPCLIHTPKPYLLFKYMLGLLLQKRHPSSLPLLHSLTISPHNSIITATTIFESALLDPKSSHSSSSISSAASSCSYALKQPWAQRSNSTPHIIIITLDHITQIRKSYCS